MVEIVESARRAKPIITIDEGPVRGKARPDRRLIASTSSN